MNRARDYKKEYGDSFVSVEHLVLGYVQDDEESKQLKTKVYIILIKFIL